MNAGGILPTRNWQTEVFDGVEGISGETMKEKVVKGHRACFACSINCTKYSVVPTGPYKSIINGPDYETVYGFGSICEVDDIEALCKADELCDEYGIDLIQASMAWPGPWSATRRASSPRRTPAASTSRFGNADAMIEMTEMIGKREGLGALLAKGTREAAKIVGKGSERFAIHNKGVDWPGHTCRPFPGAAVGYATGPRGGSHHDIRPTLEKSGAGGPQGARGQGRDGGRGEPLADPGRLGGALPPGRADLGPREDQREPHRGAERRHRLEPRLRRRPARSPSGSGT